MVFDLKAFVCKSIGIYEYIIKEWRDGYLIGNQEIYTTSGQSLAPGAF